MTIANQVVDYVVSGAVACGLWMLRHVPSYLKEKVGEKHLENVKKDLDIAFQQVHQKKGIAYDAVRFAQDAFKSLGGPEKLQKGVEWALNKGKSIGINLTKQQWEEELRIAYQEIQPSIMSLGTALLDQPKTEDAPAEEEQKTDEGNEQTPTPAPIVEPAPAPEPPKPVTEMTSTDIKEIVTQVVQDHLQPQAPTPTPAAAQ